MKFLIIHNKNKESLENLIQSLSENVKGQSWAYETFDTTGTLEKDGIFKVSGSDNLKDWILKTMSGELDDLYAIIDENKLLVQEFMVEDVRRTMSDPEILCFSLALGKNITFCSNMNCDNIFKPDEEENGIVKWDWSVHYMDFGYPLNLDGTFFRGKEFSKLVRNVSFKNAIELENGLQIFDDYPKNKMAAFYEGKMIEIVFENTELRAIFDYNKLPKDRTKYQILKKNENSHQVSDEITT